MKYCPWLQLAIHECGEPLIEIPSQIHRRQPHPYQQLGAPYGDSNPYVLRQGTVERLLKAHEQLQGRKAGWRFSVFDAYRPRAVQQFMVDHCFQNMRQEDPEVSESELWDRVYTFWAIPSADPATPPAHSTGAAIDICLLDAQGRSVDMGTPIDDFTERARPDYFADAAETALQKIHANRMLLRDLMLAQGFQPHPAEWWHFSYGDQIWAWQEQQQKSEDITAIYGCAEDLSHAPS